MDIEKEIQEIQERNRRVTLEKAWEISTERKVIVALCTYVIVVLFFLVTDTPKPFLSALVPTGGFLLSTLSLDFFKKRRIQKQA